jgi:hypothetical protein
LTIISEGETEWNGDGPAHQLIWNAIDGSLFLEAFTGDGDSLAITEIPKPKTREDMVQLLKLLGAYRPALHDHVSRQLKKYATELMEDVSPGGIILAKMPEPEPTPEPQEPKPERWCFTVGFYPFESHSRQAKDALEVLYGIGLGRCGLSRELWEKRERVRELLDQLSQEMVGEVPSIEELC